MTEPVLYTVEEVATALRVSRMTVYRLLDAGEITYIRVGRTFRIPQVAVMEYVAVNTRKATLR
jgi:excisionase family DNA binding protein